jgi:hypothetical protein
MTIREMIIEYQNEITNTELFPDRAAEILVKLSSLLGNITDEITRTEMTFNRLLNSLLDSEPKANRAKIKAECSPEYEVWLNAKNTFIVANELIKSLKYFIRLKTEDYKHSGSI